MRLIPPLAIVIVLFAGLLQAAPHASAQTTHTLSGKVVSDAGEPLSGATVSAWSSASDGSHSTDKAETGADGSFKLSVAAGKGSINAWYEPWRASADLPIEVTGDASGLVLTMKTPPPKTAVVEGVVTDASDNPVSGATVTISQGCCYLYEKDSPPPADDAATTTGSGGGSSGSAGVAVAEPAMSRPIWHDGDYQQATTGADGKFSFKTYAGPRQLSAWAKGYAQTSLQIDAVDGQTTTADVTLEKVPDATAVVKGRVFDAKTGAPLANAGVSISNLEWSRYDHHQTGADGSFEFTTLPGWTQLSVHYYGADPTVSSDLAVRMPAPGFPQKQYYQWIVTFDAKDGENTMDARLEPKPEPTIALIGYVIDPEKKAGVPGASVSVWNQDTGDWGSATTDETGSYKILVRAGHYTMNAYAQNHLPGAVMFVVANGEATKRVDVETPAGQQKHAPCEDCGPYPMPMAMKDASMGATSPAASNVSAANEGSAEMRSTLSADSPPGGADSTRAAAYSGSGGGLPAYDPAKAGETSLSGADGADARAVPGAALAFAVVALAGVAIALRRR